MSLAMDKKYTDSGATFCPNRLYRYQLWRVWNENKPRCSFVGLNPSTADETEDDATIRKCVGFAQRWGFGSIDMLNLFAWRSREPVELLGVPDPIGLDTDQYMKEAFTKAERVILAWGKHTFRVARLVRSRLEVLCREKAFPHHSICLGRNGDGSPRHPLMLAYSTQLEAAYIYDWWTARELAGATS